ncbi:MAG: hypothetical protein R6U85_10735 [Salinivirgaceae bacterium]
MISAKKIASTDFTVVKNNEEMLLALLYYARGFTQKVFMCEKSLLNYHQKLKDMIAKKEFKERKYELRKGLLYIRKTGEHVSREALTDEKAENYLKLKLLKPSDFVRMPEPASANKTPEPENTKEKKTTYKKKSKNKK